MPSIQRVCSIENCERPIHSSKLCNSHYLRKRRFGDPLHPVMERKSSKKVILESYPEYIVWKGMRQRCNDKNNSHYIYYGAKGVSVCERWNTFSNFYEDMGPRPSKKHSIDRIDANKDYEPGNCRWVTAHTQALNRGIFSNNKSGYTGVHQQDGLWVAKLNGKIIGYYKILQLAVDARQQALRNHLSDDQTKS